MNTHAERQHKGAIVDIAVDGRNKAVLSISHDGTIRRWDDDLREIAVSEARACKAGRIAVSRDGSNAVAGWWDRTIRIYDPRTLEEKQSLSVSEQPNHGGGWPLAVAISNDGGVVAAGSMSLGVRAWNVESGRKIFDENHHSRPVNSLEMDWDDGVIVSGSADRTIIVRKLLDGTVETLSGHEDWVNDVAMSPHCRHVISASDDFTVRCWYIGSPQVRVLQGHSAEVKSVDVDESGRRIATASNDHTVKVWDLQSGRLVATYTGDAPMRTCRWLPDGKRVVAGDEEGRLHSLLVHE